MKKYIVVYQKDDLKLLVRILTNLNEALEFMTTTKRSILYEAINGISYEEGSWYFEN